MSEYVANPKTDGSGILACIPQTGRCPNKCADCFFQSGRSYLEPLDEHLPNMPSVEEARGRVVRVNDGNDSNNDREWVMEQTAQYPMRFYNTALKSLDGFDAPVVLTANPGEMTDVAWHEVDPCPPNLMFVRMRTNTWNLDLVDRMVDYYSVRDVPIVLTFMAYYSDDAVPRLYGSQYTFRKRTLNSYWAITTDAWRMVMARYQDNLLVHSCGKIEGERGTTLCRHCGNCLREYFATMERLKEPMK